MPDGNTGVSPPQFTLHQTIPTPDGRQAICVWEAASIADLQVFLDAALGPGARNEYAEVVNKDGIALPTALQST
ncbi:MAG TPA: hypothetical protein VM364_05725 [Vicinamibacterales bacterium]|nr:hypothetical protein [Vicinamibacterales bacterium]